MSVHVDELFELRNGTHVTLTKTDHSQGTQTVAGPPTSHMRHDDDQAGDGPRQTDP
jgi:hypothetical protein